MEQDSEFLLLNSINELTRQNADISQRDLSRAINLSLGMTNVLLKRLREKGYVLIQKVSPRNVTYILTPDGMNELAGRTYRYLKRTMKKVVNYKETIVALAQDAKIRGFTRIGLLGKSDIDFIIEYAAAKSDLQFTLYLDESEIPGDSFVFISESFTGTCTVSPQSVAHLQRLLTGEM
jgi:predicted transcriptional regulator